MKEIEDIIGSFKKSQQENQRAALATVVHVEGSSYRRPGARMLVTEDGQLTGAISGGCLEGDALRKALLAINQQQNKLVTYNTMDDEDNTIGIQLGCNGIVHILFEPIDINQPNHPISLLERAAQQTSAAVVVTLFSLDNSTGIQPGTCLLAAYNQWFGELQHEQVKDDIQKVFDSNVSLIKKYDDITAFIELLKPPVEIVIAGAGNDAFPLMEMANVLGWHVTIADGRKTHANSQRFKNVKQIIVGKPNEVVQKVRIHEQTFFILLSHNYNYDIGMLRQLIKTDCRYIGILGPKKKLEKMLDELRGEGITITEEEQQKIYGPIGLDIGAETPEEIALSIIAEIKAVISHKEAAALRNKNGFIHDHSDVMNSLDTNQLITADSTVA